MLFFLHNYSSKLIRILIDTDNILVLEKISIYNKFETAKMENRCNEFNQQYPPGILFVTSAHSSHNFNEAAINLIKCLSLTGLIYSVTGLESDANRIIYDDFELIEKAKANKINPVLYILYNPDDFTADARILNLFYTSLNSTVIGKDLYKLIKDSDYVIAPNRWSCNYLDKYISPSRLNILPLPMDLPQYWDDIKPLAEYQGKYVFYSIMYPWLTRKNIKLLIDGFKEILGNREDVLLYIKTVDVTNSGITDYVNAAKCNNIIINTSDLSSKEIWQLHKSFQCYCSPTRFEGWSYPVHQALLAGNFVVATGWSGIMENINHSDLLKVNYKLIFDKESGAFSDPVKEDYIEKLLYSYNNKPHDDLSFLDEYKHDKVSNNLLTIIEEALFKRVSPKIEAYMVLKNGDELGYPFEIAIKSVLPLVSKFLVLCDGEEEQKRLRSISDKIEVIPFSWNEFEGEHTIAYWEDEAMKCCNTDWIFKVQANEIYGRSDLIKIAMNLLLCDNNGYTGMIFNFIHHLGKSEMMESPPAYDIAIRVCKKLFSYNREDGFSLSTENSLHTDIVCHRYGWYNHEQALKKAMHHCEMFKHWGDGNCLLNAIKNGKLHVYKAVKFTGAHPEIVYKDGLYDIME